MSWMRDELNKLRREKKELQKQVEAAAAKPSGDATPSAATPHWDRYRALKTPGARTVFWNAYAEQLRAEAKLVSLSSK